MFGSRKWVLLPSVSIQGRETEGQDGAPRAGWNPQVRPGLRAELDRVRCSLLDPPGLDLSNLWAHVLRF